MFLTILLVGIRAFAMGPDFEVSYQTTQVADTFFVDLYIRELAEPYTKVGNMELTINFNNRALCFLDKVASCDGPWDDGNLLAPNSYTDVYFTDNEGEGRVALNCGLSNAHWGSNYWPVSGTPTRVGRLAFWVRTEAIRKDLSLNETWSSLTDYLLEDLTHKIWFVGESMVPVELSSFAVHSMDGKAILEWVTSSETSNLGFYVFRSGTKSGPYTQINQEMIPGKGNSASRNEYRFSDESVEIGAKYFYQIADVDYSGTMTMNGDKAVEILAPAGYELEDNYPNPFNPGTTINFRIRDAGQTTLTIYNTKGQKIRTLMDHYAKAGAYSVVWDARDDLGHQVSTGVYLYTLRVNDFEKSKMMQFVK